MRYTTSLLITALAFTSITGCSTQSGPLKAPPGADNSPDSADVTVYRDSSIVGAMATMIFTVNGEKIYGLDQGQRYNFRLAPGYYGFGYYLGMNECRRRVHIQAREDYVLRLAPNCVIEQERGPPAL
jgi:predicted small lipoprotein YifL